MATITNDIKTLMTIKVKPRHDVFSDQYSRIFMVKLLMVCALLFAFNEHRENISCIVPEGLEICKGTEDPDTSCDFVHSACWIQGLYVYKMLEDQVTEVGYYGIPKDIDYEGYINGTTHLCMMEPKLGEKPNPNCVPMEKTFYLQYQWMSFFVAALAILHYLPYLMFCKVNDDLICLRKTMKTEKIPIDQIMNSYFKSDAQTKTHAKMRLLMNVIVKMLYVCATFISFLSLDNVLNGEYIDYGTKWVSWASLHNTMKHDYLGARDFPKPGNKLLPPFGYCEFYESAKDLKQSRTNKFKVVCEMSQHVLYQYAFLIVWFSLAIGMLLSVLGLIHLLCIYFSNLMTIRNKGYYELTLREMDYILYIKTRDATLYGDIMEKLEQKQVFNGKVHGRKKNNVQDERCFVPLSNMCRKKRSLSDSE